MRLDALTAAFEDWLENHLAVRRLFPWLMGLASLALLLVCLHALFSGSVERHFGRGEVVAFELFLPEGADVDLDEELLHATQAMAEVKERVTASRGRLHFIVLRLEGGHARAAEAVERVAALLPVGARLSRAEHWPLVPTRPTLFARFGTPEVRDAFSGVAARATLRWLAAGAQDVPLVRRLEVRPDARRAAHFGLEQSQLVESLERALGVRPPLVSRDVRKVTPSAWESPLARDDATALLERVLAMTVERTDGREIPLADVATAQWTWEVDTSTTTQKNESSFTSKTRSWLLAFAQGERDAASVPWRMHWTREDILLAGGVLVAAACAAVTMMGTIAFASDLVFLVLLCATLASFFQVSTLVDDAGVPQTWLLAASAFVWAALRFLPWRLSLRARSGWNFAQAFIFAGTFIALAMGFSGPGPTDARPRVEVSGFDDVPSRRVLRHGQSLGALPSLEVPQPARVQEVSLDGGTLRVALLPVLPAPSTPPTTTRTPHAHTLALFKNGSPTNLDLLPEPSRSRMDAKEILLSWMLLSFLASAFAAALMGGGKMQWVTRVSLHGLTTLAAGGLVLALGSLALPQGADARVFQFDILVPWTVALSAVCQVWLDARTRQLQARQIDGTRALVSARRQLLRTALTFLACAVFLWPTVLLLDRFVSAAVLSTFWLACAFLAPCLMASFARQARDSLAYWNLARRVRRLATRTQPLTSKGAGT